MRWGAQRAAPAVALAAVLSLAAPADVGLTAGFTSGTAPPPTRQGFGERLAVRETELVFGPSDLLGNRDARPDRFRLTEDGLERPVLRAERLPADAPWSVVLYVDRALASPQTAFRTILSLAQASAELTRRASVELVVADPEPRTVVAATRDPRLLADRLAGVANELRRARDERSSPGRPDSHPAEPAAVRRQLDRLVAFLGGARRPAPHALFLVADGIALPPALLAVLDRDRVESAGLDVGSPAASYVAAARTLAAYGWVTLPMTFRRVDPDVTASPGPAQLDSPVGARPGFAIDLIRVLRYLLGKKQRRPVDPRRSVLSEPGLVLLRAVARTTGGEVVGYPEGIAPALEDLAWRWHLWFAAPAAPDGRLHPVAVELAATGTGFHAPQWVRSGVPEGLADARLGTLLAAGGTGTAGDLRVELRVETTGDGATVRARLASPLADPAGPVRVSIASDAGLLHRGLLAASGDAVELTLTRSSIAAAHRVAAVIEDLGGDRWGGAARALGRGGEAP